MITANHLFQLGFFCVGLGAMHTAHTPSFWISFTVVLLLYCVHPPNQLRSVQRCKVMAGFSLGLSMLTNFILVHIAPIGK